MAPSSPPPFQLECTTPLSVSRLLASKVLELWREEPMSSHLVVAAAVLLLLIAPPRGAIIVASRSRCNSVAPVPPCLNSAFHDRDNDIVAWYNPSARPKRPAPGLERAPRRRLFEACRLEIKRGARASPERLGERLSA
ncbi:hypothetical protein GW17_00019017 [Ensete ventricosum]|nr:hypothetical protein GW17_00019017 [Ensete ventricosum]